ncbi:hypothetical protein ACFE04_005298 [Oxalis oulophora]
MAMATAEQPLKKRKHYDFEPDSPLPQSKKPTQTEPEPSVPPPETPSPPSQDEILAKLRIKDEIRSAHECNKRLKACVDMKKKGAHHVPELEQVFHSLFPSSKGAIVVQRILADLIPRYAIFCPTALETAVKVVIDMHNSSLATLNRGEYSDGVAFQIAKACVFGLVNICGAVSSEELTSSFIQGISSSVFQTVMIFFASLFKGKDFIQSIDKEFLKILDSEETFNELKQKVSDGVESSLLKLSQLSTLSLLRIFFACPKNFLAACFELLNPTMADGFQSSQYFLSQVVSKIDSERVSLLDKTSDVENLPTISSETHKKDNKVAMPEGANISLNLSSVPESCLLRLVLVKNPTLKCWMYKKLHNLSLLKEASEITTSLKRLLESFGDIDESQMDSDWDDSYANQQCLASGISVQTDKFSSLHIKPHGSNPLFESGKSSYGNLSNTRASVPVDRNEISSSQIAWHFDGDPTAMDIWSASKQLWLSSFGPDASEAHIRFNLERFGPLEHFFFPIKGFAVVEYRNIFDAIRAREYIRGHFPWRVMFTDSGLGTRGVMNGYSAYVYVGNILSQWARDEILYESRKIVYKGPYTVTDLNNEGALLLEYETPDEAANIMSHLRHFRREKSNCLTPHGPNTPMMSHLSSLLLSVRAKYNVNQNSSHFDNHISGKYPAAPIREEPSSILWMSLPSNFSHFLTDDELMAFCGPAIGNTGSVVKLTRATMQIGCGWFVECSNIEAANTLLTNLRACPGMFLRIEFRLSQLLVSELYTCIGLIPDLAKYGNNVATGSPLIDLSNSCACACFFQPGKDQVPPFSAYPENNTIVSPRVKSEPVVQGGFVPPNYAGYGNNVIGNPSPG